MFKPIRHLSVLRLLTGCGLLVFSLRVLAVEEEESTLASTKPKQSSPYTVELSPERQKLGGLRLDALKPYQMGEGIHAYGRVVEISPLLDLRSRYRAAQSELVIVETALAVSKKNHDRLAKLHSESIIPTRDLILAESQLATESAKEISAKRRVQEIREEALQSFGPEIFRQAVEGGSAVFEGLLNHSLVLVLVALPAHASLPKGLRSIELSPSGGTSSRTARLLAASPRTEEATQGETWFFVTEGTGLRTGMRLDARIQQGMKTTSGVLLPASAVVWRDGKPWVYLLTGDDDFSRFPVGPHTEVGSHWFVAEGLKPGDQVVVVGGQMLLSEEQRHTAPVTDDDD